jgi:hypothetical protein
LISPRRRSISVAASTNLLEVSVRSVLLRGAALAAALAVVAAPLAAQRRAPARRAAAATSGPRLGPHLGYNFDAEAVTLGAQLAIPIAPAFDAYPTFDYYFVDAGSLWSLNFDLRYRPPTRFGLLYAGGGLNYSRVSGGGFSDSRTNLNILGGFERRRLRASPYIEARITLGDESSFQLVGGVSWRI